MNKEALSKDREILDRARTAYMGAALVQTPRSMCFESNFDFDMHAFSFLVSEERVEKPQKDKKPTGKGKGKGKGRKLLFCSGSHTLILLLHPSICYLQAV